MTIFPLGTELYEGFQSQRDDNFLMETMPLAETPTHRSVATLSIGSGITASSRLTGAELGHLHHENDVIMLSSIKNK